MILPIVAYGDPVLKKKAVTVEKHHLKLKELISDMWETMYAAHGVGLAAPQIGESLRLFIVDGSPLSFVTKAPATITVPIPIVNCGMTCPRALSRIGFLYNLWNRFL